MICSLTVWCLFPGLCFSASGGPVPLAMHTPAGRRPPKRLLFDRRYGWVVDEWRDPSEEALAGGRGMFCILPIVKSLVNFASQTIDSIANTAVEALEKRGQNFSPKSLLGSIHEARESDHMDEHIAKNSHDGSKVDYMNKHLQKEALFDLTTKQI